MRRRMESWSTDDLQDASQALNENAHPLNDLSDLEPMLHKMADCKLVMLGEASHGTHEYYTWRSKISQQLISDHGFNFIAVEGDWPDCYRLNRFIKNYEGGTDGDPRKVLHQFGRWPTWMWANWEVEALAAWLKNYNSGRSSQHQAGFYGLDVYSLNDSMEAIMEYLKKEDPQALKVAEKAYRCFEPYNDDEGFGYASALRFVPELCEKSVLELLATIEQRAPRYDHDPEAAFSAEQNAHVAVNAERYYRAMLAGGPASWNERDLHMQETLERLFHFHGPDSKGIVWAHNTHVGDARYTDMHNEGMHNIGSLSRERFGEESVFLLGFGSYQGSVIAGQSWGAPMQRMPVPKGIHGSWEAMLHAHKRADQWMLMESMQQSVLAKKRIGHRAIGVVYDPQMEQYGNYVPSVVARRYDGFLFIHDTQSLHPMKMQAVDDEVPETYPFGV